MFAVYRQLARTAQSIFFLATKYPYAVPAGSKSRQSSIRSNVVRAAHNAAHVVQPVSAAVRAAGMFGFLFLFGSIAAAGQLTVRWDDNSTNELGFKIERSANGSSFAQIATVGANITQYVDGTVSGSTTYSYRVRAYTLTSYSAYSNVATVKTTSGGLVSTSTTTTIPGRLAHLSARAVAGKASAQSLILNYKVINSSKSILLRGIGPGLAIFTTAKTLPDPVLNVFDGSYLIASNDNWGGTSLLWSAFKLVGAFSMAGYSKDAALVRTFPVKSYSAIVNGNYSGLAMAEIYDADTATSPAGRLSKIFARASVGTGSGILVVGLVIRGNTNLRLLIRAIGPSLTGVTGVLQNPKLALYRGTTLLRSNDNWGGGSSLSYAFTLAGASALSATSKDSAIDVTLAPGTYTATVSGVNSTLGVARFEAYEIR
jgi:hypothetical protein